MKTYTPRDIRRAVVLAVILTAIVVISLLDPSCQRNAGPLPEHSSHAVSPR